MLPLTGNIEVLLLCCDVMTSERNIFFKEADRQQWKEVNAVFYNFHNGYFSLNADLTSLNVKSKQRTLSLRVVHLYNICNNSPAGSFHPPNDVQNIRTLLL